MIRPLIASAGLAAMAFSAADAQESFVACPSQQEIEQVLQSDGGFIPDDCRPVTVNRIDGAAGPVCVLDFQAQNGGVLDQLTDAATTTQWWVSCDILR